MSSDRDYFNARAKDWDKICVHDPQKLSHITSALKISPSDSILDVGTGTGATLPYLHRYLDERGRIFAIDISEKMLEVAKSKYPQANITYCHGDILTEALNETFDIILCYSMFPHFKGKKIEAITLLSQLLTTYTLKLEKQ